MKIGFELESMMTTQFTPDPQFFYTQYDGSIHGRGIAVELTTKPFDHTDLDVILSKIKDMKPRLTVNRSCGLHVHVDMGIDCHSDLMKRTIINITKLIYNNQTVINKLLPRHRRNAGWCRNWTYREIEGIIKKRTILKTYEGIYRGHRKTDIKGQIHNTIHKRPKQGRYHEWRKSNHDRYHTINLLPLLDIGTVEFRMYHATLDERQLRFYIGMTVAIVQKAIRTQKVRIFRKQKMDNNHRNELKRLWEFLRSIDYLDQFKYAKKLYEKYNQ
jgi:hypothetical protein